ncbi:MAG: VOC family protein [Polyangiaceae bacterium]|nr:VOC family protein [Polyangiaceae bacterium]
MRSDEGRALELHHLALGAADVERVAAFYREVFRLHERTRYHTEAGLLRSIWLDLGNVILMIERSAEAPRRVDGVGRGPFLLAFRIEAAERDAWEARMAAAGAAIEARTLHTSYARDPEGNRVAVSAFPERCAGGSG